MWRSPAWRWAAVAAGSLCGIQRVVGQFEQLPGAPAVLGAGGNARGRSQRTPADADLRYRRAGQFRGLQCVCRPGPGKDEGELLAAESRRGIGGAHGEGEARSDGLQNPVSLGMPVRVVDGFEAVEVDDHET